MLVTPDSGRPSQKTLSTRSVAVKTARPSVIQGPEIYDSPKRLSTGPA